MSNPLHTLDQATQRVDAANLDLKGIRTLRVLNESKFLSVLERLVEDRLRSRLANVPVGATRGPSDRQAMEKEARSSVREDYRARWDDFRSRYEGKLRAIEAQLAAFARDPGPPER